MQVPDDNPGFGILKAPLSNGCWMLFLIIFKSGDAEDFALKKSSKIDSKYFMAKMKKKFHSNFNSWVWSKASRADYISLFLKIFFSNYIFIYHYIFDVCSSKMNKKNYFYIVHISMNFLLCLPLTDVLTVSTWRRLIIRIYMILQRRSIDIKVMPCRKPVSSKDKNSICTFYMNKSGMLVSLILIRR